MCNPNSMIKLTWYGRLIQQGRTAVSGSEATTERAKIGRLIPPVTNRNLS